MSPFLNQLDAPEHESAETLGRALFNSESFEAWAQIYTVNSASIFFVTTAFLGLLAKGSEDRPGYTSCVINNSSISAHIKLAQNHVRRAMSRRFLAPAIDDPEYSSHTTVPRLRLLTSRR